MDSYDHIIQSFHQEDLGSVDRGIWIDVDAIEDLFDVDNVVLILWFCRVYSHSYISANMLLQESLASKELVSIVYQFFMTLVGLKFARLSLSPLTYCTHQLEFKTNADSEKLPVAISHSPITAFLTMAHHQTPVFFAYLSQQNFFQV